MKIDLDAPKHPPDACPRCGDPDPYGPQHAVVAFSPMRGGRAATILCATPHLICDLEEGGVDACDIWALRVHDGESMAFGLRVWEGTIEPITYPSTPNGPEEYDVEYPGDWRELTDAEWAAVREGRDPWAASTLGMEGIRDPGHPCADFQPGEPDGRCDGDGHYLCIQCTRRNPKEG